MQYSNVRSLIAPLISNAHKWQNITINGEEKKPQFFLSNVQLILLLISCTILFKLTNGISKDIIGYIMSAFSISVSLFMSLLVSIFDKFDNTIFEKVEKSEEELMRLVQKKNFFKRFISITSYLVVMSILVVILCSLTYLFDLSDRNITISSLTFSWAEVDFLLTLKNILILGYRVILNYFLLNYLFLTFFITGSAFEYYMSEMNSRRII